MILQLQIFLLGPCSLHAWIQLCFCSK